MEEVAFEQIFEKRQDLEREGIWGRYLRPTECPIQRAGWGWRAQTHVDSRVGWEGCNGPWVSGRAPWALLGRQKELLKGLEQGRRAILMVHLEDKSSNTGWSREPRNHAGVGGC